MADGILRVSLAAMSSRIALLTVLLALLLASGALLSAGDAPDPLLALPSLPKPKPIALTTAPDGREVAPGIAIGAGQPATLVLSGTLIIDQGPVDGMEVLACLPTGKTHESLVRLAAASGQLVKATAIATLGLDDGVPAPEATGQPGRGTPLRVVVAWQSPDQPGKWLGVDASSLIRDRTTDKPYPALPFIYTGSRILEVDETGLDSKPVKRKRFMLDSTKSVIDVVDEPDALLASPFPGAGTDKHFEAYGAICPPAGTAVRLIVSRAELALTLTLKADGTLSTEGKTLDDAALQVLLTKHYGEGASPTLRALAVTVAASVPREQDIAARSRILAAAAAAKAWVVPVFVPGG